MGRHIIKKQGVSHTKHIQRERNMFVAERFIAELIKTHDKHSVSTAVALGIHRPVSF